MFKFIFSTLLMGVLLVGVHLSARGDNSIAPIDPERTGAVIAFSHASEDVGAIDIYIDHNLVLEDFSSADATAYIQVAIGDHLVDVVPAGANVVLIKTTDLAFEADHMYQLTLTGREADWSVGLEVADETMGSGNIGN